MKKAATLGQMEGRIERKPAKADIPPPVEARATVSTCPVCASASAAGDPDKLCWVCRRLKISAWRDSDHQLPSED
jgi:hypothetical protein